MSASSLEDTLSTKVRRMVDLTLQVKGKEYPFYGTAKSIHR